MTTKMKTTFLTALFFFGLLTGLQAQDKFEFASVSYTYCPGGNVKLMEITTPGGFVKKKIDFGNQEKSASNLTFLFAEVSKLQDEGWEIITFNSYIENVANCVSETAFLKRKKK